MFLTVSYEETMCLVVAYEETKCLLVVSRGDEVSPRLSSTTWGKYETLLRGDKVSHRCESWRHSVSLSPTR